MAPPARPHLDAFTALAHELATDAELVARLQATHTRTPTGCCAAPTCGRPGYGTPAAVHPCAVRVLADLAAAIRRAMPVQPDPDAHPVGVVPT